MKALAKTRRRRAAESIRKPIFRKAAEEAFFSKTRPRPFFQAAPGEPMQQAGLGRAPGLALQRKAKTPPIGNADLFDYSVKGGKASIAVADARRILTWKKDITALLQNVTGQTYDHDMRFLLVLAMKFTEQAGKKAVAQPEGNNPFNIMGKGPAGSFSRKKNKEYEKGKQVTRPAKFAAYETEAQGTKAFLDILKEKWGPSFTVITQGGAIEDFAKGLRPKQGGHYLTKPLDMHISHLKYRMRRLVIDLQTIFAQSIAEASAEIADLKPLLDYAMEHLNEGSIEDQKIRLDNARNLSNRIAKLEAYKAELQAEIASLVSIQERIAKAQAIQDPATLQTGAKSAEPTQQAE